MDSAVLGDQMHRLGVRGEQRGGPRGRRPREAAFEDGGVRFPPEPGEDAVLPDPAGSS
ncbi:hypothetical protein ACFT8V_18240 [Streptomyces griseoincarnatus]|uniref:hypothetical protein n=1 Tax=Streptomyces sp. BSE7-9 TaxID=2759948 RepID=UPI0018EEC6F8|nr:hypothetical protein [Streptomyces sp. BSE7-9]MBJ6644712.1 hypothetical protein [Streptomyces sp. BSE7-9]